MIVTGERQVAPTLDGVRRDHVARYQWAAERLPAGSRVVDFACGIGYGTQILCDYGHRVTGFDNSQEALDYARTFYSRIALGERPQYKRADTRCPATDYDAAVCFETIEHVANPVALLLSLRGGTRLLVSVPNEDVIPYGPGFAYHHRHYTREQFRDLLHACGWEVREWFGQEGPESEVEQSINGRTIIADCERIALPEDVDEVESKTEGLMPKDNETQAPQSAAIAPGFPVPSHVAIIGLGPTDAAYTDLVKRLGGKHAYCDEVWVINAQAGVLMHDRVFHMDDVRIQELRVKESPGSNIARMLELLKSHPGPIYTSRAHPDYPGTVDFPLEDVVNALGRTPYFNGTSAYAVAFAIFIGVKRISLFGVDFTYPNQHQAEQGRACVEYWLGVAAERGIEIRIPKTSTLMDAMHARDGAVLYGYDTVDVTLRHEGDHLHFDMAPKEVLPTAAEMEQRYDHGRHPNAIVAASEEDKG